MRNLEDDRRLMGFDEGVVFWTHGVGQARQDVVVGIDRVHVEGKALLGVSLHGRHLFHGIDVGLRIRHLEWATAVLPDHIEDRESRPYTLVDHLVVNGHLLLP